MFRKLWLEESHIRPSVSPLVGFEGTKIAMLGMITLSVEAMGRIWQVEFVIINTKYAYNAIMERGWIHEIEGIALTLHQVMRCLSPDGTKTIDIQGDEQMALWCYNMAMKESEESRKKQEVFRDQQLNEGPLGIIKNEEE